MEFEGGDGVPGAAYCERMESIWRDQNLICKEHFWLFSKDFLVVARDIGSDVKIVIAFCADKDMKETLHERYANYRDGKSDDQTSLKQSLAAVATRLNAIRGPGDQRTSMPMTKDSTKRIRI